MRWDWWRSVSHWDIVSLKARARRRGPTVSERDPRGGLLGPGLIASFSLRPPFKGNSKESTNATSTSDLLHGRHRVLLQGISTTVEEAQGS